MVRVVFPFPRIVGLFVLLVNLVSFVTCTSDVQQQRTTLRILNENNVPSGGAGDVHIMEQHKNDVATNDTAPEWYFVLTHDVSSPSIIYAQVASDEKDLYNGSERTIIPCKLGTIRVGSTCPIHCMDHDHTIHLNVSIHIAPDSGEMHYTDSHNHVRHILPNSDYVTETVAEMENEKKFSTTAIICLSVAGVLTAVFFTYCTCCCCPIAADHDDDDDRKVQRDYFRSKKNNNKRGNSKFGDDNTVDSAEDQIRIQKKGGKYSYGQDANLNFNRSLVDVDLSESARNADLVHL